MTESIDSAINVSSMNVSTDFNEFDDGNNEETLYGYEKHSGMNVWMVNGSDKTEDGVLNMTVSTDSAVYSEPVSRSATSSPVENRGFLPHTPPKRRYGLSSSKSSPRSQFISQSRPVSLDVSSMHDDLHKAPARVCQLRNKSRASTNNLVPALPYLDDFTSDDAFFNQSASPFSHTALDSSLNFIHNDASLLPLDSHPSKLPLHASDSECDVTIGSQKCKSSCLSGVDKKCFCVDNDALLTEPQRNACQPCTTCSGVLQTVHELQALSNFRPCESHLPPKCLSSKTSSSNNTPVKRRKGIRRRSRTLRDSGCDVTLDSP